jgi:hypothetical protein
MDSPTHEPFLYQASPAYDRLAINGHWGPAQHVREIADGIKLVSTASHGGYILSINRFSDMLPELRHASFTNDQCFEEDCSWCAVCLMWPEYFPETALQSAVWTWKKLYAEKHGTLESIFPYRF